MNNPEYISLHHRTHRRAWVQDYFDFFLDPRQPAQTSHREPMSVEAALMMLADTFAEESTVSAMKEFEFRRSNDPLLELVPEVGDSDLNAYANYFANYNDTYCRNQRLKFDPISISGVQDVAERIISGDLPNQIDNPLIWNELLRIPYLSEKESRKE